MEADGQRPADAGVEMGAAATAVVTDAGETAAADAAVRSGALMRKTGACIAEACLAADTWGALVDQDDLCSIPRAVATAQGLKQRGRRSLGHEPRHANFEPQADVEGRPEVQSWAASLACNGWADALPGAVQTAEVLQESNSSLWSQGVTHAH